jgi:hypothetical protein
MTFRKAYSNVLFSGCMRPVLASFKCLLITLLIISGQSNIFSQELPEYDEISVFLDIPGVGGSEIDALIKSEELYLPVIDLFDFLKIRNVPSSGLEDISGFFVNPDATYLIDRVKNQIIYQDKIFNLEAGDLIRTESNLYLKSSYFGKVFGLECKFNFRSLSVNITSKLELPLIREMKQEEMRHNIARLKGDIQADTNVGRTYPSFKFGMADWSVTSSQEINGITDARVTLALGSMIAGGEATANLYYNSTEPFTEKQQYYLWRYVNNDFAPLRQVMAGKILTNSISTLYNPVIGVQLTNTPTTYRRSFGSYTLTDKTEPGWIVELYVNNVLVDYVKADASGFFTFQIPLVYGNSLVKLKFFGPWGEERIMQKNIIVPYNFLPAKILEYSISGGIVEDTLKSRFSRANVNYGATRNLTIGGGVEYLSSVTSQPLMPYVNASLRITNNLLVSGEYSLGVRAKGILSLRLPSNLQFDLNYTWYDKDQKAIFYNYREERKASLSFPLKIGKFNSFQRFSLNQIVLPSSKYTTGEWLISGSMFGVNTNLTTYALFIKEVNPYVYSDLSFSFRLPARIIFMPQIQYGYNDNKIFSAKAKLEKYVFKHGFINLSYEQNFSNNMNLAELGFRYDFSFAQTGASVRQYNDKTSFIEYARGSLINDRKTKYLGTDNRPNVGRGGISVVPFLDLNENGKKDPGEPRAYGLNLYSNGGRIEKSDRDTTIRILGLEPYTNCYIDLDPNSFENVSWRLQKQTYSVAVDPEILKLIEIPISVAGEATGYVLLENRGEKTGQGRVIVSFFDTNLNLVGKTFTEEDGYFSYFGLTSGNYSVRVDTSQLRKLDMTSSPEIIQFSIANGIDGDIAEGLDFVLKLIHADTIKPLPPIPEVTVVTVKKDTTYVTIHEITEEVYTITEDSWAIQIGAFKQKSLAEGFRNMLEKELGKDVEITMAGEYYRVRILDLPTRQEVDENIVKLNKLGFKELWIIRLLAMQQQRILITREDSLARIKESLARRETPLSSAELTALQLRTFQRLSDAIALKETLSAATREKARIVYEGGYYRLVIPEQPVLDPTVLNAIRNLTPSIGQFDMKDTWKIPPVTRLLIEPAEKEPVSVPPKAVVKPESTLSLAKERTDKFTISEKPNIGEPVVALQVAIYHKESKALKAKKKIMSRLNLPVEIVRQYDYYHVIITGFYTKEQTYEYYPELAGLGFPGITLIQNYKKQE